MSEILVIDDEVEICELLKISLEMAGHRVKTCLSARDAKECLERTEYDFVIIDMIMPEVSGLEMIRYINDRYPRTLTILTTGLQTHEVIKEALKQGAYNFVNKPFSLDEITKIINVGARARAVHTDTKSIQPYLVQQLHFVLPSRKELMEEIACMVADLAGRMGFSDKLVAMNIPLTVDELFLNAVIHGNKEDENKTVLIKVVLDADKIAITIKDQGEGFDWRRVLARNTPADLESEGGRGVFLVKHYVDKIEYNENGNEVSVIIGRDRNLPQWEGSENNDEENSKSDTDNVMALHEK